MVITGRQLKRRLTFAPARFGAGFYHLTIRTPGKILLRPLLGDVLGLLGIVDQIHRMTPERFQLSGRQQVSRTTGPLPQLHQFSLQPLGIGTLVDRPKLVRVQVPAVIPIGHFGSLDKPRMHTDPRLQALIPLARSQPGERLGHLGPALLKRHVAGVRERERDHNDLAAPAVTVVCPLEELAHLGGTPLLNDGRADWAGASVATHHQATIVAGAVFLRLEDFHFRAAPHVPALCGLVILEREFQPLSVPRAADGRTDDRLHPVPLNAPQAAFRLSEPRRLEC